MSQRETPPQIVVRTDDKNAQARWKKRHPAKTGMLIAVMLWPVLFGVVSAGLSAIALGGARRMANGQYVIEGQFGNQLTTAGELVMGSICVGGFFSTGLFAAVMIVLWVVWFATKN